MSFGSDRNRDPETGESTDVSRLHAPIMREKNDPRDGHEPIPVWFAGLFGLVTFWGGWYVGTYSADFRGDIYEGQYRIVVAAKGDASKAADPAALGKKLFAAQGCVACHQATGAGVPGQYPPLANSEWVTGSPAKLSRILISGLQGPVTVAGSTYNGNMPAFGAKLKDDGLAALLTYLRQEWGNKAEPITPEMVAAAREASKDHSAPWTEAELKAIPEDKVAPPKDQGKEATSKDQSRAAHKDQAKEATPKDQARPAAKPASPPAGAKPPSR